MKGGFGPLFFWRKQMLIVTTGAIIGFTGTSARVAIPPGADGAVPRFVRVAANAACYCKFGDSGVVAVAGDFLVQPADSVNISVPRGATHIAAIQVSAAGTAQISPVEDGGGF
jgi:hypothetical protein